MSRPIFDFGESLEWDKEFRESFYAVPAAPRGWYPLPSFGFNTNSRILVAGARNPAAEPTWYVGAWMSVSLPFSPSSVSIIGGPVEIASYKIPLGRLALIRLPDLEPRPFLLRFKFPRWHQRIDLELWRYSGPDSDTDSEALARIEAKLNTLTP